MHTDAPRSATAFVVDYRGRLLWSLLWWAVSWFAVGRLWIKGEWPASLSGDLGHVAAYVVYVVLLVLVFVLLGPLGVVFSAFRIRVDRDSIAVQKYFGLVRRTWSFNDLAYATLRGKERNVNAVFKRRPSITLHFRDGSTLNVQEDARNLVRLHEYLKACGRVRRRNGTGTGNGDVLPTLPS